MRAKEAVDDYRAVLKLGPSDAEPSAVSALRTRGARNPRKGAFAHDARSGRPAVDWIARLRFGRRQSSMMRR